MNVTEVSEMLKVSPQTLRVMMQLGLCPFGTAFKKKGSKHWTYVLYPEKVNEYCGEMRDAAEKH